MPSPSPILIFSQLALTQARKNIKLAVPTIFLALPIHFFGLIQ
jgi:hypothetical protein